ncbi:MAG: cyclic nucleotide-binding domain-containing protein [Gammaproteobacteria bacterium]|jgi:Fe-S-cluster-containing dehydrogenase component/CRP-like cAMP-binding protein
MADDAKTTIITRQKKWDRAFGEDMTSQDVESLLGLEPFRTMVEEKKSRAKDPEDPALLKGLKDILLHETRIMEYRPNEIIVRQGDYGGSAFLMVSGQALPLLDIEGARLGRSTRKSKPFTSLLKQFWSNPKLPEVRDVNRYTGEYKQDLDKARRPVILKDAAKIASQQKVAPQPIQAGTLFEEVSAIRRSARTATVVAETDCKLLEIKWQGLRDLMSYSKQFRRQLEEQYRQRSLKQHLQTLPLFQKLPEDHLNAVIAAAVFESFGKNDWNTSFKNLGDKPAAERLKDEPLIIEEGEYANGLILIQSGFARVSRKYHKQQQTLDYMRVGDMIGVGVLMHNINNAQKRNYEYSVRALGYTDILRIPAPVFEQHIYPFCKADELQSAEIATVANIENQKSVVSDELLIRESALLEFFVERRFINGTKTMIINTDRCTNCDDCVRACAMAHENNPRFIRHGLRTDKFMVANACMHCSDPVCMIGCPTGAIHRRPGGQVVINDDTCIGCATCANSCPYNNIRMVSIRDRKGAVVLDEQNNPIMKATKCDLCEGQWVAPACERSCPHDAMKRIDIHDITNLQEWLEA